MVSADRTPHDDDEAIRRGRGKFACMAGAYTLGVFNDNFFKQAAMLLAVRRVAQALEARGSLP